MQLSLFLALAAASVASIALSTPVELRRLEMIDSFATRAREVKADPPVLNAREVKADPPVLNAREVKADPPVLNA